MPDYIRSSEGFGGQCLSVRLTHLQKQNAARAPGPKYDPTESTGKQVDSRFRTMPAPRFGTGDSAGPPGRPIPGGAGDSPGPIYDTEGGRSKFKGDGGAPKFGTSSPA